jgi:hypothetical protein
MRSRGAPRSQAIITLQDGYILENEAAWRFGRLAKGNWGAGGSFS